MASGDLTQGRRLPDGFHLRDSVAGDFWRQLHGLAEDGTVITAEMVRGRDWEWTVCDPDGRRGGLGKHAIDEHEDGTITATPSILHDRAWTADEMAAVGVASIAGPGWHGYLERGVWREA